MALGITLHRDHVVAAYSPLLVILAGLSILGPAVGFAALSRMWRSELAEKSAIARILETEERLKDLTAITSDWIWETDTDHRFRYVSGRIEELANIRSRDLVGKTRTDLGMATDDPAAMHRFLADLDARRPFRDYIYYIGRPNDRHYFRISGQPIFAPDGTFEGYRGTGSDITAQRAALDLAKSARARLHDSIESISEGYVLFDAEDRLILFNDKAREIMNAGDMLRPGVTFAELIEYGVRTGHIREAAGQEVEWTRQRLARHYSAASISEQQLAGGRWISINERRTRDGGTVMVYTDITSIKEREAALTESESRAARLQNQLLDAIESISDGFVLYDADNRLVVSNSHYREMYAGAAHVMKPGATRTEVTSAILASGDVKDLTPLDESLRHYLEVPGNPRPTFERQLANGRWLRVSESPTRDGGIVGVRTDITELKRREAELARQTSLLQTTFENMAHGISIVDNDLNIVGYNRLFLEMLEFPRELFERPSVNFADVVRFNAMRGEYGPGDVEEQVRVRVEQSLRFEPHCFERTRPDGTVIEIRGDPLPGGGCVTIYTDITLRRRAEAALRASEDRYRQLVEVSPDAILVHRGGAITFANTTAVRLLGYASPEELIGRTVFELADTDYHAAIAERIGKLSAAGGAAPVIGIKVLRRDGSKFAAEVSAAAFRYGDESAILTVIRDVSERRRAESELRLAKEQAEAANRSKTEFLANMSHELRTPLNAVIGFSEIIAGQLFGPLGSRRYVEYAEDIHDSGQHLLSLINDILDLSKAEAGKLELHETPLNIATTVESCLRVVRERAERGGVTLHNRVTVAPSVRCDERMLKQILLNLLSNAVKFTPQDGEVAVEASLDPLGAFQLQIRDTGIGIAEEDIPRALQAFTQVDSALSRKYDGTGLGLPLTKTMVELHGGRLLIHSVVGEGTVVTVLLPAERVIH